MTQAPTQKLIEPEHLIHAELVYDQHGDIRVPERLGVASEGQLQGSPLEKLAELAGRVCYDSLGSEKSRNSGAYHSHIQEVGHLSVYEHAVVTLEIEVHDTQRMDLIYTLLNRPGFYVRPCRHAVRITFNLRALLDFDKWDGWAGAAAQREVWAGLTSTLHEAGVAPQLILGVGVGVRPYYWKRVEPETDEEQWVTLFLSGSRGMSHEIVRHGDFTAMSQRSTRYVDEAESQWVEHPLVRYMARRAKSDEPLDEPPKTWHPSWCKIIDQRPVAGRLIAQSKQAYRLTVEAMQEALIEDGVDKFTARKQARGAARGYLGNALYTELIFSASVGQWKRMLALRCSDAADAEIRILFAKALQELKRSCYCAKFMDFTLKPAKDGIGEVLA